MKKRIITLLIASVLLICSISAFAIVTSASSPAPELNIAYCNLSFRDSVCIKYAVSSNVSDVKILIWTSPEAEYTVGTHDDEITEYYTEDINGTSHMIFDYTSLSAKQMTDVVYARAYSKVDGVEYYSGVNKYSILQYAYNKLGKTATESSDTELKEMLTHMLAYGAAAQKYLDDYKVDRLATANWYQIELTAGVLDDGCTYGLYLPGDKVTITAPATDTEGTPFAYWKDSSENEITTSATYELTVGNANEVYTPVYVELPSLEFSLSDDGKYYTVVGMGAWTDTDLIIPDTYNGLPVTTIGVGAFAGQSLTSVTIGSNITSIGKNAFRDCYSIATIYFNATNMSDLKNLNGVFFNAGATSGGIHVIVGANVTQIPAYLFFPTATYGASEHKVTALTFAEGSQCKTIGSNAFNYCSFRSISLPNTITSIGYNAFGSNSKLKSIKYAGTVTEWKAISKSSWIAAGVAYTIYCTDGTIDKDGIVTYY